MERQYKDSGLKWIGKIPETWKVDRFKNRFKTGKGLNITKGDLVPEGIPVVSYGQVHSKQNTGTHLNDFLIRYIPSRLAEEGVSSKVSVGDFIFADTSEDIDGCGNAVYVDKEIGLYAGYHSVIAFAKHPEESKYYSYLFLTECWRSQIRMRVTGIKVFSISQAILNETTIILPPLAEQQHIADFLDKKCGEIDGLIALQDQMIAHLTNYKQSVITETVTKGLNPSVQLIPSGIDWIDVIPKEWKVCRIKDMVNLQSGTNLTTMEITDSGHFPVYGGNGIRGYYHQYSNDGDFILIGRQGALCGNINYASGKFWATEHAVVCYPKRDFARIWLGELLRAMNLGQYSLSAAQPGLAVERIKNLKMPLPPIDEQQSIAFYLDTKCSEIDRLIETKQHKIETLKEYKKSVIYEAVTGKTDII